MAITDWNLIVQGNISLLWCQWSITPENRDKSLGCLLEEFREKHDNVGPFNIGLLLMASYILFVYPQQAEFGKIDFSRIDTSRFLVHEGTPKTDVKRFCSRIRNSLTHSRFAIESNQIQLTDENGTDKFRATINLPEFGDFVTCFMSEVKRQHFVGASVEQRVG